MVKAREMVRLAGELNERLTFVTELNASSGGAEPETATSYTHHWHKLVYE